MRVRTRAGQGLVHASSTQYIGRFPRKIYRGPLGVWGGWKLSSEVTSCREGV